MYIKNKNQLSNFTKKKVHSRFNNYYNIVVNSIQNINQNLMLKRKIKKGELYKKNKRKITRKNNQSNQKN